jgi:hypothetical protein
VHWKVGIHAGKASNEVIFPNADGTLGGVLPVIVRGDKLKIHLLLPHILFESC